MFKMNKPTWLYKIRISHDCKDKGYYWYVPKKQKWIHVDSHEFGEQDYTNTQYASTSANAFRAAIACPAKIVEVSYGGKRFNKVWVFDKTKEEK